MSIDYIAIVKTFIRQSLLYGLMKLCLTTLFLAECSVDLINIAVIIKTFEKTNDS